jgi:hypothetical protein
MSYDTVKSALDRAALNSIRRATTQLEFSLMAERNEFDFAPDAIAIRQYAMIVSLALQGIMDRVQGLETPHVFTIETPL